MKEVERIANQIHLAYYNGFWGGGSLRDLFQSLTFSDAALHPIPGAHSAWEIALHLTVWNNIFRSRIEDEDSGYPYDTDWPTPAETTEANWTLTLDDLDYAYQSLLDAVRKLKTEVLYEFVPGKKFTFYEMLHGVSQHDYYHAGQVMMLKKAISAKSGND
jgi:uncharacterized damage-inducible protein DinB